MYHYIKSEPRLWTVGTGTPGEDWNPESDHDTEESAAQRVSFLNGGSDGQEVNKLKTRIEKLESLIAGFEERIAALEDYEPSDYECLMIAEKAKSYR